MILRLVEYQWRSLMPPCSSRCLFGRDKCHSRRPRKYAIPHYRFIDRHFRCLSFASVPQMAATIVNNRWQAERRRQSPPRYRQTPVVSFRRFVTFRMLRPGARDYAVAFIDLLDDIFSPKCRWRRFPMKLSSDVIDMLRPRIAADDAFRPRQKLPSRTRQFSRSQRFSQARLRYASFGAMTTLPAHATPAQMTMPAFIS